MNYKKFEEILIFKKEDRTWKSAVAAYNRKHGTKCSTMDGTRTKKLNALFDKISSKDKEKLKMYFIKNVIALSSFIEEINKIENYGIGKLINWVESKIPDEPEVRVEHYGQLNLKDYFKFMATKEF